MSDIITILTAKKRRLNKTISRCPTTGSIVKSKYDRAKYFDVEQRPISDLNALYVLLVELQGEPHKCVMRGVLKNGADSARGVRRTLDGADATLTDAKHYWLLIDVDEWPIPESFAALTPEETVDAYIITALPPEFHAVSYVLQWSNGFGLDDGKTLNAHLWFWMDRAIGDKRCKQWAEWHNASKGWRVVDPMVCVSNEPLYTAGPQFDGVADPLPGNRLVLATRKYDLVNLRLPPLDWKKPAKAAAPTSAGATPSTSGGEVAGVHGWRRFLARIGDDKDGFHEPIRDCIASYVRHTGYAYEAHSIKAEIRQAANSAVARPGRVVADSVSDEKLNDLMASAFAKYGEARASSSPRSSTTCAVGAGSSCYTQLAEDRENNSYYLGAAEVEAQAGGGEARSASWDDKRCGLPQVCALSFMRVDLMDNGRRQGKARWAAKLAYSTEATDRIDCHHLTAR